MCESALLQDPLNQNDRAQRAPEENPTPSPPEIPTTPAPQPEIEPPQQPEPEIPQLPPDSTPSSPEEPEIIPDPRQPEFSS